MALSRCELRTPSRDASIAGDALIVRGKFAPDHDPVRDVAAIVCGIELGRAEPRPGRRRSAYAMTLDVAALPCRLTIEIVARHASGAIELIHTLTVWRTRSRSTPPRLAPVAVDLAQEGGWVAGQVRSTVPVDRIEFWSGDAKTDAAVWPDGRFRAEIATEAHVFAVPRDPDRPEIHLGRFPLSPPDDAEDVHPDDLPRRFAVRRRAFQPLRTLERALRERRRLALIPEDGPAREVVAHAMIPVSDDWAIIARAGNGFRAIALRGLAGVELGGGDDRVERDPPGLEAQLAATPAPSAQLASDAMAFDGVAIPSFGLRPPPPVIDRVILLRPEASALDELVVLAPLMPVLATAGIMFETVTASDAAASSFALKSLAMTARTVVIVCGETDEDWLDRLVGETAPFVIHLLDGDPLAAVEGCGPPHRERRRMIERATGDLPVLLKRCDRLVVTSRTLHERYVSAKTVLIEPAFVRRRRSLDHLEDTGAIKVVCRVPDARSEELELIALAFAPTLRLNPRVRLEILGDVRLPEAIMGLSNVNQRRFAGYEDETAFAAANPAHILLAPLLDTRANAAASIADVLGAATFGAAGLFSDAPAHAQAVTDGTDGVLVANHPKAWRRAFGALIASPKRIGGLARAGEANALRRGALDQRSAAWRRLLGLG